MVGFGEGSDMAESVEKKEGALRGQVFPVYQEIIRDPFSVACDVAAKAGNLLHSLHFAKALVRAYPHHPFPHVTLGDSCRALELFSDAMCAYETAIDVVERHTRPEADLLYKQATTPRFSGKYDEKTQTKRWREEWQKFWRSKTLAEDCCCGLAFAYYGIAQVHKVWQRTDKAIDSLHRAGDAMPEFQPAWCELIELYEAADRWADAVPCYEKLVEALPSDTPMRGELAKAQLKAELYRNAVGTLQTVLQDDTPTSENWTLLAEAYTGLAAEICTALRGDAGQISFQFEEALLFDEARHACHKALALDGNNEAAWQILGFAEMFG